IDLIIPMYINSSMPDVVIVLFMLTLLAAAMSTLSALFHTMGSAAGHDLWSQFQTSRWMPAERRFKAPLASSLKVNRIGTAVMIVVSVGLAFLMPGSIIARATAMFMGLCAAAFLPMFTYGIFVDRPSAFAAKLSLLVGAFTWFFWTAFVHVKESSVIGLCKLFFGTDALFGAPWTVVDPLVIAIPAAIISLIVGIVIDRYWMKKAPDAAAEA
ncbi:MAG TPA: sodium:solute symporter family protein, partial [Methanomassiliicoccales archaeon]|nr:sodium:solute symporter family protein [Methanomassiliicoccales archaeon]